MNPICGCCKDVLDVSAEDYVCLSCRHEFHYECIYETFKYNFKRNPKIIGGKHMYRECPCCRFVDRELKERDGYPFSVFVRENRPLYVIPFSEKTHLGEGYCRFKSPSPTQWDGNTCNRMTTNVKQLCSYHKDTEYNGHQSCVVVSVSNGVASYCNYSSVITSEYTCPKDGKPYSVCVSHMSKVAERGLCRHVLATGVRCTRVCYKGKEYCQEHRSIIKQVSTETPPCPWIYKTGVKKGTVCGRANCKAHRKVSQEIHTNENHS